jgi:hypothetical protein
MRKKLGKKSPYKKKDEFVTYDQLQKRNQKENIAS